MNRESLIKELERTLEQLKNIKSEEDQMIVHQVDTGGYTDGHKELLDFRLNIQEEDGDIIIDYIVEEGNE